MRGPFTNLVQQVIIQYTLWLPGNQIMSGIVSEVTRPRDNPGRQRFRIISWIARHNGYLSFHSALLVSRL